MVRRYMRSDGCAGSRNRLRSTRGRGKPRLGMERLPAGLPGDGGPCLGWHGYPGERRTSAGLDSLPCDDLAAALFAAASSHGLREVEDFNESDEERIGLTPIRSTGDCASAPPRRSSPGVKHRPNLTVMTHTRAERVVVVGTRAFSVEIRSRGARRLVAARREIILAAGAPSVR